MLETSRNRAAELYFNGSCLVRAICTGRFQRVHFSCGTSGAPWLNDCAAVDDIVATLGMGCFLLFIAIMLALDLGVFRKKSKAIGMKERILPCRSGLCLHPTYFRTRRHSG